MFFVFWNTREKPLGVIPLLDEPRPFDARSLEAIRRAHAGRPFVLSLWSMNCAPCAREMPLWREMQARNPGVKLVLVSTDGAAPIERVKAFLRRHDPGPVENWRYADEFEERIRHSIDPKWRGAARSARA